MSERICDVEGCGNLGKTHGPGRPRAPQCAKHRRERWPALAEGKRAHDKSRRSDGRQAAQYAAQLTRGVQIRDFAHHHLGGRLLHGLTKGDGLTLSRTCPDDCPQSWVGWHSGLRVPYRLCIWTHYTPETQAENNARKVRRAE
jgi:hypothetical protein